MRDEDDRGDSPKPLQQTQEVVLVFLVQSGRGLVEQHHRPFDLQQRRQCGDAGDVDALLLAGCERAGRQRHVEAVHPGLVQRLFGGPLQSPTVETAAARTEEVLPAEERVLIDRQRVDQRRLLEHPEDAEPVGFLIGLRGDLAAVQDAGSPSRRAARRR